METPSWLSDTVNRVEDYFGSGKPTVDQKTAAGKAAAIPNENDPNSGLVSGLATLKKQGVSDDNIAKYLAEQDPRIKQLLDAGVKPKLLVGAISQAGYQQPEEKKSSTLEKAVGVGQAAGSLATQLTTGFLGQTIGSLVGVAREAQGAPKGYAEKLAADMAEKYSYTPLGDEGQEYVEMAGKILEPFGMIMPEIHAHAPTLQGLPKEKVTASDRLKSIERNKAESVKDSLRKKEAEKNKPQESRQQELDFDHPNQFGQKPSDFEVDENGIPIRKEASLEAQTDARQGDLFSDEQVKQKEDYEAKRNQEIEDESRKLSEIETAYRMKEAGEEKITDAQRKIDKQKLDEQRAKVENLKQQQLEAKEEQLRKGRPDNSRKPQGPKTREAKNKRPEIGKASKDGATRDQREADPAYKNFKTVGEALTHLKTKGNDFQKALVDKIFKDVKDAPFRVVEPGKSVPGGVPRELQNARGVQQTKKSAGIDGVWVKGEEFGPEAQGVNSTTVLHEALHQATVRKIRIGALKGAEGTEVQRNVIRLNQLQRHAIREYNKLHAKGLIPQEMEWTFKEALGSMEEFVTWGLTEPVTQRMLKNMPGLERKTLFSDFVNGVRKLLGMDEKHDSALADLIDITSDLIDSPMDDKMKALEQQLVDAGYAEKIKDPIDETIEQFAKDSADYNEFKEKIAKRFGPEYVEHAETLYRHESKKLQAGKVPHEVTDEIIRTRINNIAANERIVKVNSDFMKHLVKDVEERNAVSEAIDSGRTEELPERQRDLATYVQELFADIGQRAVDAGVLKGLRENYVTHIIDWEKSGIKNVADVVNHVLGLADRMGGSGTSTKSRFGRERKYNTFEDLQKALGESGLVLKTKDIADIYKEYARSMERAIENKKMIESLKGAKDIEGTPFLKRITESDPIPRGWQTINSPQMMGYAVHPDVAPSLRFVFSEQNPGILMRYISAVGQITKRLQVMGSLFHAKSLVEANFLSGFGNFAKEVATGFKGTRNALEMYKEGGMGDAVDKAIKNGLQLEVPEDVSRKLLGELGHGADWIINKYAGTESDLLGKTADSVEKVTLGLMDKVTWDYLHTGFKLQAYMNKLEKMKLDHPDVPEEVLAREVASHVNNTFGGLNWFDVASRTKNKGMRELAMSVLNPKGRTGLQILMFAPDWTISTIRALTTAFGEGSGMKGLIKPRYEADLARQYQLRAALAYGTILEGINLATSGQNIWDNDDPTRIELEDGSTMQLAKHSMEPVHWILNPMQTLANKIGFVPRVIAEDLGGLSYLGPNAPKEQDTSVLATSVKHLKEALPFQVASAVNAPEGEGFKTAMAGTLGFPVYPARKPRKKQRPQLLDRLLDDLGDDLF